MFTGLIEAVGRVSALTSTPAGFHLQLQTGLASTLAPGDSLAVDGVCLTATRIDGDEVRFDIGPETARVTTLGQLVPGRTVNLERPMRGDARFGGHFVQGHVDGLGLIEAIVPHGDAHTVSISFPPEAAPLVVSKGSIAVDGVSLTVAHLDPRFFDVMIIPFTWANTTFGTRTTGERVNLEFDIVGKYVARVATLTLGAQTHPDSTTTTDR